jgi:Tat protein secretion system quality control protein TatD with DNase activity
METTTLTLPQQLEEFKRELTEEYVRANKPVDGEGNPQTTCRFVEDNIFVAIQAVERKKPEEFVAYLRDLITREYKANYEVLDEYEKRYHEAGVHPDEVREEDARRAEEMMATD